ncbi:MAG TPA: Ig-like domain-containing protein [Gemmatimonadaceae bacterium]|nr:Ig-like domain-containing protein [Gemmatimonadaceae bacterium]
MSGQFSARARGLWVALAYVALSACGSPSDVTSPMNAAQIRISANVSGTAISTLVVTVTGDGFSQPLVFNAEVQNGQASATLAIPAGPARTFAVKAYDSQGEVTHEGSKTVDVNRGQNPPVSIPLVPRNGHIPVEISMGDYSVTVTPGEQLLNVGETVQLTAEVTAPNGDHPSPDVMWATADPSIASVSSSGFVTARRGGTVQIIATYGGVAGIANIIVRDESAALSYLGPQYPPPGGVTFTSGDPQGVGLAGQAGGVTNTYQNFNLSMTRYLAFGADATDMPALMFNSVQGNTTVDPTARMTFDMSCTNPNTSTICYTGTTFVPLINGGLPVRTRLTLTLSQTVNGVTTPLPVDQAPANWADVIGGVGLIQNAFSAPDAMLAHRYFEASLDGGTTWGPALSVFNGIANKPASTTVLMSFTGGFYYSF